MLDARKTSGVARKALLTACATSAPVAHLDRVLPSKGLRPTAATSWLQLHATLRKVKKEGRKNSPESHREWIAQSDDGLTLFDTKHAA
jgi:hypothetical protein